MPGNSVAWISLREKFLLIILKLENVTTVNSYLGVIKDEPGAFVLLL